LFQFQSAIRAKDANALIIDFTAVPYIDSAGIGAFGGAYFTHNKDGRSLALVGVSDRIHAALQVTRRGAIFSLLRYRGTSGSQLVLLGEGIPH